jgi:hypothetical protein
MRLGFDSRGCAPYPAPRPKEKTIYPFLHLCYSWITVLTEVLMYEIDKGVPLPEEKVRHNYPHEALDVGESFHVPGGNMNILCNYNRIRGKRLGRKFVCRREGDGIRVWRIE